MIVPSRINRCLILFIDYRYSVIHENKIIKQNCFYVSGQYAYSTQQQVSPYNLKSRMLKSFNIRSCGSAHSSRSSRRDLLRKLQTLFLSLLCTGHRSLCRLRKSANSRRASTHSLLVFVMRLHFFLIYSGHS